MIFLTGLDLAGKVDVTKRGVEMVKRRDELPSFRFLCIIYYCVTAPGCNLLKIDVLYLLSLEKQYQEDELSPYCSMPLEGDRAAFA